MPVVSGVNAAVPTPRRADGSVDEAALRRTVVFLAEHKVVGIAINGATGEFPLTTEAELSLILDVATDAADGRMDVICGVGAAGLSGVEERISIAAEAGVKALLLPMPYFFPYQQDDVVAFATTVARGTTLPILLYNLPQFTTGYTCESVSTLFAACENIVGIKDSSGSLDILRKMTSSGVSQTRIVGNDGVLAQALRERACDGVISGVAGVAPELITDLFEATPETFDRASKALDEFIAHIDGFPTPWGLKFVGEARGLFAASFAQPVSEERARQGRELQEWFTGWWNGR